MLGRRIPLKALAILGVLALSLPLSVVKSSPASAGVDCHGNLDESASVTCSSPGHSNGGPIDTNWTYIAKWADPTCPDTGIRGSAVRPGTTGPVSTFCIRTNRTQGVDLIGQAQQAIPLPDLNTDYQRAFLTGAKVTFDVGQTKNGDGFDDIWKRLEGFDNVWLHLQPERFRLDFGDGSPVSEWNADDPNAASKYEHIYSSTAANVDVTLTVWWSGFVHGNLVAPGDAPQELDPNDPGTGIQSLGQVHRSHTLSRPVVEVWSALTEPNN